MTRTTDVAIIGGGVIGCSIAYQLAKRGITSTVFEKDRLASSASGATAGIVGPIWYVDHTVEPYFELAMRSLDMFPKLTEELKVAGVDPEYREGGVMKVALDDELQEVLQDNLIWQGELGMGVHWIDQDELRKREPHVTPDAQGAVLSPNEGSIRGEAYVNSLAHAAAGLGATILERTEVTGLEFNGSRVIGVRTMLNDICYAGHTVLAAGAWTGLAAHWLPETIPVRPVKGQRITLRMPGFLPAGPVQSVIPQNDGTTTRRRHSRGGRLRPPHHSRRSRHVRQRDGGLPDAEGRRVRRSESGDSPRFSGRDAHSWASARMGGPQRSVRS